MPAEENLRKLLRDDEWSACGLAKLDGDEISRLYAWGMRMYSLGQHVVGRIADVKYDGKLVVLDDGTRWEVDSIDAGTAGVWSPVDQVIVIDNEMYNIEGSERIAVQEDLD